MFEHAGIMYNAKVECLRCGQGNFFLTHTGKKYLAGRTIIRIQHKFLSKMPAVAVSGPFGAVKEQASGLYAQTIAERGFITLAFDPSYTGESGGEPRHVASPDINTEDFSAAVDFFKQSE